ncbi:uncharacterized protein LOC143036746 isoform X2 [Oratosquilla oratoria]|uniref:uncharacterized protein LOC143036746 isoform X2 n=1 Tax=Oratosquilla oratoria TaxID=337810 RepID=UPI003F769B9C
MIQEKTNRTSVPQIFFNEEHVGGYDSLEAAFRDNDHWQELLALVRENEAEDGFLRIPHPSEAVDSNEGASSSFRCEKDPILELYQELIESGIIQDKKLLVFTQQKNVFPGDRFVSWLIGRGNNEEHAIQQGNKLLQKKFIVGVTTGTTHFVNSSKEYYRLTTGEETVALNRGPSQGCILDKGGALPLAAHLRDLLLQLFTHVSSNGKVVDYVSIKDSTEFAEYVTLTRELQRVPLETLDEDQRKAFFINIYNALVIHAFVSGKKPTNMLSQMWFYDQVSYIIGSHQYSLNDIENGVLRANRRGPLQLRSPFRRDDPRLATSLIQVDPRIHFALNCGAKSCPPIKTFSGENVNEELQLAMTAYLESDEALQVRPGEKGRPATVLLSSLLKWYAADFGSTSEDVLRWVATNVKLPEKKDSLEAALTEGNWSIKYIPYDWGHNGASTE